MSKYDQFEIAKIFGQPVDPRRPYPRLIEEICDVDTAEPDEYHYYFDVLQDTDKVYVITTGGVTQENVTSDTPAALSFVSLISPEYYVKLTDLTQAKERVVARKLQTINRAMNAYESYNIINAMGVATTSAGRVMGLTSGTTTFNYENLVTMMDNIIDYGDSFTLVAGTLIDRDIKLWDWNDNKYTSLAAAFKDLEVNVVRVNQTVSIDGTPTAALASTNAFLVAKDTEMGKPNLFVRKKLNDIDFYGGSIMMNGDKPQRLVFVSPNPITVTGTARYLAVGVTGFEEFAGVVKNVYGLYEFNRA